MSDDTQRDKLRLAAEMSQAIRALAIAGIRVTDLLDRAAQEVQRRQLG